MKRRLCLFAALALCSVALASSTHAAPLIVPAGTAPGWTFGGAPRLTLRAGGTVLINGTIRLEPAFDGGDGGRGGHGGNGGSGLTSAPGAQGGGGSQGGQAGRADMPSTRDQPCR